MGSETLEDALRRLSREGELCEKLPDGGVRCLACGHGCRIRPGQAGICRVRFNEAGRLKVPYGYVAGLQLDPIEKKPFYHVLPGSAALSFGMLGCNLRCAFCQNWFSSQALRDPKAGAPPQECSAADIAAMAAERGAPVIASTYNEPLITAEWAAAVFREGKGRGLRGAFVSNGYASPGVLGYLKPWVDYYKIDLKAHDDKKHEALTGGKLSVVHGAIERLMSQQKWLEIVTLVVPGFNDADEELKGIARFIASVSRDIPWHATAYHADYKMSGGPARTDPEAVLRAAGIGRAEGLRYVYAGNLGVREDTLCHSCGGLLVERGGARSASSRVRDGRCPECAASIPGVWS